MVAEIEENHSHPEYSEGNVEGPGCLSVSLTPRSPFFDSCCICGGKAHTHTHTHTDPHTHTHTLTHKITHTCLHTLTDTDTHAHTHTQCHTRYLYTHSDNVTG